MQHNEHEFLSAMMHPPPRVEPKNAMAGLHPLPERSIGAENHHLDRPTTQAFSPDLRNSGESGYDGEDEEGIVHPTSGSAISDRIFRQPGRTSRSDDFRGASNETVFSSPMAPALMNSGPTTPARLGTSQKREGPSSAADEGFTGQPAKKARKGADKPPGTRLRKAPEKPIAEHAPIPRTLAECSTADKYLWNQRDQGKTFTSILPHYEALAGVRVAPSTLPNRYKRMHDNFGIFDQEMDELLCQCKNQIESTFETERWGMVRELMVAKGGRGMKPEVLQKRAMQLTLAEEDGVAESG